MENTELVFDQEIYARVIQQAVPDAKKFVWLGTSDLKDMYIAKARRMVPFLSVLSELVSCGVSVRLIHAKEPGPAFRRDFDKYTNLIEGLEQILCPRVHFKIVIVDGVFAYTGSANITGAGMGAKGSGSRNFENGIVTRDAVMIEKLMIQFDDVWMGKQCMNCKRKKFCADYKDLE